MHPAQASDNAPAWHDRARFHRPTTPLTRRGCPIGLGAHLDVTTPVPVTEDRRGPHRRALPPATDLLCPPSRLAVGSRPPTPGGSQPAFARGDVASRLNPCPTHYGPAFASSPVLYPPPCRLASRRAYPDGRTTGLPRCIARTLVGQAPP